MLVSTSLDRLSDLFRYVSYSVMSFSYDLVRDERGVMSPKMYDVFIVESYNSSISRSLSSHIYTTQKCESCELRHGNMDCECI